MGNDCELVTIGLALLSLAVLVVWLKQVALERRQQQLLDGQIYLYRLLTSTTFILLRPSDQSPSETAPEDLPTAQFVDGDVDDADFWKHGRPNPLDSDPRD